MKKQQAQGRGGCLNYIMFVIVVLGMYFLYCKATFPIDLNGRRPQFFNSPQPQNISSFVFPNTVLMNSRLIKSEIIKSCEDLQISKTGLIYCGTTTGLIIQIDLNEFSSRILGQRKGGIIYGIRLSRDQKTLYFMNHDEGLCKINLETLQTSFLIGQYKGQKLVALNSIQTHPEKDNVIYFTQSSYLFPMMLHQKDVFLGNSLGRLFQYDVVSKELKLVFEGLYFANGLIYQKYEGVGTILVAQSNRYRIQRIFVQGSNYGKNVTAIQNLPMFLDNMKINQNGQIWVGGPVMRNKFSTFAQNNPIIRQIIILFPSWLIDALVDRNLMGGMKISFQQQTLKAKASYYIFQSLKDFNFVTCILQNQGKLYMSSLQSDGILVIPKSNLKYQNQSQVVEGQKVNIQQEQL